MLSKREKDAAIVEMKIAEMDKVNHISDSKELWLRCPLSAESEHEKMVASLTDISHLELQHQANLFRNLSLHGIDRCFMQARRRISIYERAPLSCGENARIN